MRSLDLFDLLAVARREDSYSSLLRHLLVHSPGLRQRILAHGFKSALPELTSVDVEFRTTLPDAGIPDLLIVGHDPSGQRWELFIENKIDARESPGQTQRYFDACRGRVGSRAAGIYLTLDGHAPGACGVKALRHADLGEWVQGAIPDLQDPVLRTAAEAYVRRVCATPPKATDDEIVRKLLAPSAGLLPLNAGVEALGTAIVEATAGWSHTPVWLQSQGHANPGLQFHRAGWRGTPMAASVFERANYNVHAEVELASGGMWSLKVHFETEPYRTHRQLKKITGRAEFETMRGVFRKAVHQRAAVLPGWKMTNYRLQVCALEMDVSAESTVREAVAAFMNALNMVGPVVEGALDIAKGEPQRSSSTIPPT